MILHKRCPLCTSEHVSFFLKCTDHLLSNEEFLLSRCDSCGFIFTREYPDLSKIGNYYESGDYISHDDKANGLVNRVYLTARKIMLHQKKRVVIRDSGIKEGRLLDIGCGTGYFAATMKKAGWDVTGIEPNEKAGEFALREFGLKVLRPRQLSELPDKSFDLITLWHVLEHLHDLPSYTKEIIRLLSDSGTCLVAIPNCGSFDAEFYGSHWAAYDVPRHLWHFTPDTFGLYAAKSGLQIKQQRVLPLDVFYISALSEKNKGNSFWFIRGIVRGSVFACRAFLNRRKSSSLIYILQKNKHE